MKTDVGAILIDWGMVGTGIEQALALMNMFATVYLDGTADWFAMIARANHAQMAAAFSGIITCLEKVHADDEARCTEYWRAYKAEKGGEKA